MKWFEKQTSKGILKYRMPTILEAIKYVRILREFFATDDLVGARLVLMENIQELLDYTSLDGISSFEDINKEGDAFTSALYQISDEILNKVVESFAKKD